jgi:hypothetical protein
VLDQNSKPLFTRSVQARIGWPGVPLNAPITGGSIVKLEFSGDLVVYNLWLSGQATFYDRVFPPSEPPVGTAGGTVVNPLAFKVDCNTAVSTADILLIHEAALEQWALDGYRCGTATLKLQSQPPSMKLNFDVPQTRTIPRSAALTPASTRSVPCLLASAK